jgi:mannose-1-phosphate guanylyltransferase/mannose-6-phosphate isomerase
MSLQSHQQRSEHWVVLEGTADVQRGDEKVILQENESAYIPKGMRHRLGNSGKTTLQIIEVQQGEYLGDDDIERF